MSTYGCGNYSTYVAIHFLKIALYQGPHQLLMVKLLYKGFIKSKHMMHIERNARLGLFQLKVMKGIE